MQLRKPPSLSTQLRPILLHCLLLRFLQLLPRRLLLLPLVWLGLLLQWLLTLRSSGSMLLSGCRCTVPLLLLCLLLRLLSMRHLRLLARCWRLQARGLHATNLDWAQSRRRQPRLVKGTAGSIKATAGSIKAAACGAASWRQPAAHALRSCL